jgi:Type II secretion system (T2SS), protein G
MKRLVIIIAGIAFGVFAWMELDDFIGIPPRVLTATRMWVVKRRILQYAHSHNQLPHSLSELPIMQGYDNDVEDEWGRMIAYLVSPSGLVTLTSLGRDRKQGGTGKDADMVATFPSRDGQGNWSDGGIEWSHNPSSEK